MIQLNMSEKGEIVIPKKIRESIGLSHERPIMLELNEKSINLSSSPTNVLQRMEDRARKFNLNAKTMIYGDRLYEDAF